MGLRAGSTALIAAALDDLADAPLYGVSLYAVGRDKRVKVLAAPLSGWLLIMLAVGVAVEAMRRFFWGDTPTGPAIMSMAAVNAGLNLVCLKLLSPHRGGVNFKASAIFTSNDMHPRSDRRHRRRSPGCGARQGNPGRGSEDEGLGIGSAL